MDYSVPAAKINNGYISFKFDEDLNDNILKLGSVISTSGKYSDGGIITTKEAQKIDAKFDDGVSYSGKIIGYNDSNYNENDESSSSDICIKDDF